MRVMIIHTEVRYFGGAEKMLGYFLNEIADDEFQFTIALGNNSRVKELAPRNIGVNFILEKQAFSLIRFLKQVRTCLRIAREKKVDLIHAWVARDWELAGVLGRILKIPVVGTLHDHPQALYIRKRRQRLMHLLSRFALQKVVCVSGAVRCACVQAGYPPTKLTIIHNGLSPSAPELAQPSPSRNLVRLGYLGLLSEQKGLDGLFEILNSLTVQPEAQWELSIAGAAQDTTGETTVQRLRQRFQATSWWSKVHWRGWVAEPLDYLNSIDLLIFPSKQFDSFPTVLLEAGEIGVPALAANIGGVSEIIQDSETGWLFEPGDWRGAACKLSELMSAPQRIRLAGRNASLRVRQEFSMKKMVERYCDLYLTLKTDV